MDEARGPEDRIEQIVSEAEGGAQFEFNPAAWSAMESKLDAVARVPFNWWKLLFPVAGTAILLTLLLWPMAARDLVRIENLAIKEAQTQELSADTDETTNTEKELNNTESSDSASGDAEVSQSQSNVTGTESAKMSPSPGDRNVEASITSDTDNVKEINAAQNSSKNKEQEIAGVVENTDQNAGVVNANDGEQTSQTDELNIEERRALAEQNANVESTKNKQSPVSYFSLAEIDETKLEEDITELTLRYQSGLTLPEPELEFVVDSALYSEKSSEIQYFNKSRWAFSVAVSADLSATGLEGFTDPGTMVGFGVEYYLNDSWSIQTGATLAVKKYTALGSEYATPDWISARPDDLLSASAVCTVIDIPLNIRKYFQSKKGNTFFVSTGVSTYLMLREDYNYEYTEERPGWLPFWSFRNQNNHFFGILNLSVGYEKPLGKNLALSIEPFMKLPLTGIGEGQVRFLSFGTNIAIKLRK